MKTTHPTAYIFETEHFESVYAHIRILDAEGHSLVLFVTSPVETALRELLKEDAHRFQWVVKSEQMSMPRFILRSVAYAQKRRPPFFLLHTVSSNYILWAVLVSLLKGTRFYLTIHDINSMFASKPSMNLRKLLHHWGKKWLIRSVRAYVMLSHNASHYLQSIAFTDKPVYYLPAALVEENKSGNDIDRPLTPIHIAIPGTVDPRRRDYREVMEVAKWISEKKISVVMSICGGVNKSQYPDLYAELMDTCKQYPVLHLNDQLFVPVPEMEQTLRLSHLIWLPSKVNFKDKMGEPETYGRSKNSGVVNDAIRLDKPLILPEGFSVDNGQEPAVFRYRNAEEIVSFLSEITATPEKYHSLIKNARAFSSSFTLSAVRPLLKKMLA